MFYQPVANTFIHGIVAADILPEYNNAFRSCNSGAVGTARIQIFPGLFSKMIHQIYNAAVLYFQPGGYPLFICLFFTVEHKTVSASWRLKPFEDQFFDNVVIRQLYCGDMFFLIEIYVFNLIYVLNYSGCEKVSCYQVFYIFRGTEKV